MVIAALLAALALNPGVTQANLPATVCTARWTATVRPPASFTDALKRRQLHPGQSPASFEEDHYTPLCLGGAPRDPRNLLPQPWAAARRKDDQERALCRAVCAHSLTLKAARQQLAKDWPRWTW